MGGRGGGRTTAVMLAAADLGPLLAVTAVMAAAGPNSGAWWIAGVALAMPLVSWNASAGLYGRWAVRCSILEVERLLRHGLWGLLLAAAAWLAIGRHPGAVGLLAWWSASMAAVLAVRWSAGAILGAWGVGGFRVFLIGSGAEAQALAEGVRGWRGVEAVVLKCAEDGGSVWEEGSISPPIPRAEDEVWVSAMELGREHLPSMLRDWRDRDVTVRVFRNPLHPCLDLQDRTMLRGVELTAMRHPRGVRPSHVLKRAFDVTFAGVVVVVTIPVWLLVSIAIKIDSPGPVFFRQRRVGRLGREFNMLKFRTMHVGDEYSNKPTSHSDPRIARVGKFLRRTGVDELPQVVNVLRGEMSFVGPRPEMPFKVAAYAARERERLAVLPGITGLWQLRVHRSLPIHYALEFDLYYIERQSFLLDLVIIAATVVEIMKGVVGKSIFDV